MLKRPRKIQIMVKAGAPVELKLYPGVSHVDVIAAFADLLHKRATTRDDVLAWIDTH